LSIVARRSVGGAKPSAAQASVDGKASLGWAAGDSANPGVAAEPAIDSDRAPAPNIRSERIVITVSSQSRC
jgi:hypothetical protein